MNKVLIFGHKKPDTDSVASAIALSYLKNQLGYNTEARIIGNINKETQFALETFNIKTPKYLNDVKTQLKDVKYHKGFYIDEKKSIYDGYQAMLKEELTGIPISKNDGSFLGLVTLKDLSYNLINEDAVNLYTSYDNLINVLNGEEVYRNNDEIKGHLLVVAYRSTTFVSNIKLNEDNIIIVGDRHSVIEYAINSRVKLIILSNDSYIKEEHIELAKKNGVSIIRTPYDTYKSSRLVSLANYIKTMIKIYSPTTFKETDYVSDIVVINNVQKHTNYPVIGSNNKCLGLLKITDLAEKRPKEVILVDHNEKLQSVEGLEEANILEIFDHHALGNLTTSNPINYRNMVVGSTSTIIYILFKETNQDIPVEIAGILLSGIVSDTLILKSPTTTSKDIEAVKHLSEIANINYEEYGLDLLKSASSLEGMSKEDVLYNDYKIFNVNDKSFAVGQFFTTNFEEIEKDLDEYINVLNKVAEGNNYMLVTLYFTDVIHNGSYVLFNSKGKNLMNLIYQKDIKEGEFIEDCVSRKKHIVPNIIQVIES